MRLCCFPYRIGSGIKTKVIECMAWGIPVVTTSSGLEGFNERQKEGMLAADTPLKMSAKIIQLLENHDNICKQIINKNQKIIREEFSLAAQAEAYKEAISLGHENKNC